MINYISIKNWNHQQWLDFRIQGIGGSECGAVFNESKWDDPMKIHLNKIQEPQTTFTGNKNTKFGQRDEPEICDLFQYWDETEKDPIMAMFDNIDNKKRINNVRSVFSYVVNSKYPWLFASMDRRILRSKKDNRRGILEAKNTTSMEKNTYKYGINPAHVLQVYQYLMITEFEYAKVAIKYDGNNFDVVEFEPDKEIFESIEYITAKFWKNVEECRKIKEQYKIPTYYGLPDYYFTSEQMDGIAILQSLEPELTSVSYKWIKDLVKPTPEYTEMEGTQALFELAVHRSKALKIKTDATKEIEKNNAKIIAELKGTHLAKYDNGNISYKPNINGVNKVYVSPKLTK